MRHFEANIFAITEVPSTTSLAVFLVSIATLILGFVFWVISCFIILAVINRGKEAPGQCSPRENILQIRLEARDNVRHLARQICATHSYDITVLVDKEEIEKELAALIRNAAGDATRLTKKELAAFDKEVSALTSDMHDIRQRAEADRTRELQTLLQQFREKYTRDEPHIPST